MNDIVILEPKKFTSKPLEGVIGVWDSGQNFGWILCTLGRVFVHVSDAPENKRIPVGTKVKFEVAMNRMLQKKKAVRVVILPDDHEPSTVEKDTVTFNICIISLRVLNLHHEFSSHKITVVAKAL